MYVSYYSISMALRVVLFSVWVLLPLVLSIPNRTKFDVAFQWNYVNYSWPSLELVNDMGYTPGQDIIVGIKIYKNTIYLALPRIKKSSRITLATIPLDAEMNNPVLTPYPSWQMNTGESCYHIQNLMSMEIDNDGIMWVLDGRRTDNNTNCPPKIWLIDLNKNGEIIKSFTIPENICSTKKYCHLNDLVVDGDYCYISDSTTSDPGLVVYNRKTDKIWKIRDTYMNPDPKAERFVSRGVEALSLTGINGIALSSSCDKEDKKLYFTSNANFEMYSIPTSIIKNEEFVLKSNIHNFIKIEGIKQAQTAGMICDNTGDLYYALQTLEAVAKWSTSKPFSTSEILEQNHDTMYWPDSFAFDGKGNLFMTASNIWKFSTEGVDIKDINFRILKLYTGTNGYMDSKC